MTKSAEKTKPGLWERIKRRIIGGSKGGKPGQWSARKAQLATHDYKEEGGGYKGPKQDDNSLHQWTKEDWGTKSGKKSMDTDERYLPKKARDALSDGEYKATSAKKKADTKKGQQFSKQPKATAAKTKKHRAGGAGKKTVVAKTTKAVKKAPARKAGTKKKAA